MIGAIASEFNDEANCLVVLVIVTYAFGKESDSKNTDYFVKEGKRKNREIDSLKEKLANSFDEDERLKLSFKIEELRKEILVWQEKAKVLQTKLNESDIEIVQKINEILNSEGIDNTLSYLESMLKLL